MSRISRAGCDPTTRGPGRDPRAGCRAGPPRSRGDWCSAWSGCGRSRSTRLPGGRGGARRVQRRGEGRPPPSTGCGTRPTPRRTRSARSAATSPPTPGPVLREVRRHHRLRPRPRRRPRGRTSSRSASPRQGRRGAVAAQALRRLEGTLGIVTRAILRLVPAQGARLDVGRHFATVADAAAAVVAIGRTLRPSMLELMDQASINAVEASSRWVWTARPGAADRPVRRARPGRAVELEAMEAACAAATEVFFDRGRRGGRAVRPGPADGVPGHRGPRLDPARGRRGPDPAAARPPGRGRRARGPARRWRSRSSPTRRRQHPPDHRRSTPPTRPPRRGRRRRPPTSCTPRSASAGRSPASTASGGKKVALPDQLEPGRHGADPEGQGRPRPAGHPQPGADPVRAAVPHGGRNAARADAAVGGPSEPPVPAACPIVDNPPAHPRAIPADSRRSAGSVSGAELPPRTVEECPVRAAQPSHTARPAGSRSLYLKSLTLKGFKSFASRDDAAARARHHLHRRPQRLRQVQRRRRARLGDGRAGRQVPARRQDGGRHLRRHLRPPAAGPRRGAADHRQLRRRAADRVRRGHDQPDDVPQRRLRVRHQRQLLPAARRPGAAQRLRHRPRDARDRRPGPARRDPARHPRGPPRLHRGGRRRPQAPQAQGEGAPQARLDRGQPHPARRPAQRDPPPAQAAGPAGRGGPQGGRRPGRRPRRPGPAARRRPGHRSRRARAGARRRDRCWSSAATEVEAAIAEAREAEAALEAALPRGPARRWPRPRRRWFALQRAARAAAAAPQSLAAERRPQRRRRDRRAPTGRPRPRPARGRGRPRSASQEAEIARRGRRSAGPPLDAAVAAREAAEDGARRGAAPGRRPRSAPPPTAARGWPGCTARSTRCRRRAAAADDEVGRLPRRRERRRRPRRPRPQRDFTAPRDQGRRPRRGRGGPRRRATRRPPPRSTTSRTGSRSSRGGAARPSATAPSLAAAHGGPRAGPQPQGRRRRAAGRRPTPVSGLLGSVAALLTGRGPATRPRVAAALGSAADARRRRADADAAVGAIAHLKADDLGRAGLLARRRTRHRRPRLARRCPAGATYAVDVVECPDDLRRRAGRAAAQGGASSTTWLPRGRWSPTLPDVTAVTARRRRARRPASPAAASAAQPQPDRDAGGRRRGAASSSPRRPRRASGPRSQRRRPEPSGSSGPEAVEAALSRLHESDATHGRRRRAARAATAPQSRSAEAEAERLATADRHRRGGSRPRPRRPGRASRSGSPQAEARAERGAGHVHTTSATASSSPPAAARAAETELRLALRTRRSGPARSRAAPTRSSAPPAAEREARGPGCRARERRRREAHGRRGRRRRRPASSSRRLAVVACTVAAEQRPRPSRPRTEREQSCSRLRARCRDLRTSCASSPTPSTATRWPAPSSVCGIEQLQAKAVEELGIDPEASSTSSARTTLVPFFGEPDDDPDARPTPVPFVREEQEKRLRRPSAR